MNARQGEYRTIDTAAPLPHPSGMARPAATTNSASDKGATRKQASRQRLLDAARKLFVERGYHATRPQDISREAGLGHGTFYLHFGDKQECFIAFVEQARAEIDAAIVARASKARDLPGFVQAVLIAIYDYTESHPGLLVTVLSNEAVIAAPSTNGGTILQRWGVEWGEMLKLQAKQGLVASDFDYAIIGQAIVGAIHQASHFSFERGQSRATLVKSLTRFIVRALRPEK